MEPPAGVRDEEALRRAVLSGDEGAWRTLFDRHGGALYAYLRLRAPDSHGAEEVAQECWMVAVRRIKVFDPGRGSFWSWLRGIADLQLRNHWRRWSRRAGSEVPIPDGGGPAATESAAPDSLALREQVSLALSALPPHYQDALRAKYKDHLSVEEIAERGERSAKAVESLLTRARNALRTEMERLEG